MGFTQAAISSLKYNRSLQRKASFFSIKKAQYESTFPTTIPKGPIKLSKRSLEKVEKAKVDYWIREMKVYAVIILMLGTIVFFYFY
ncbi:MAG: hypothetical protein DHS20C18_07360 [Saprospiraceae bacterium]|nr:MAG: hypothetical protein DHS20C18_07360 [Saprospiraceae bacterium]